MPKYDNYDIINNNIFQLPIVARPKGTRIKAKD